jgi:hypothetical protein
MMAAVVAGIVLRASALPEERSLQRFKGQLTILAVSLLFILLSADLSIPGVIALGWGGILTVLCLIFVVRPLNIWVCTWNSGLNWRQKLFLSWIAPRGIVSASVASLFAILLTQRGISGGDAIKALVFLTIILTVVLQGLTAQAIASLLQVTSSQLTGVVIVGCNPLSLMVGQLFAERGEAVAIIDTNPESFLPLELENLRTFTSSALDPDVLEEAGLAYTGTFLAATTNGEVNQVVAQRAAEEFRPPRVLAVSPQDLQTLQSKNQMKVEQAFVSQLPLKTWNQYLSDGSVKLGETTIRAETIAAQQAHLNHLLTAEQLIPLVVERDSLLQVVAAESQWQVGDRLIYLFYDPKPKLLKLLSGSGKVRLIPEQIAEVENLPTLEPNVAGFAETT